MKKRYLFPMAFLLSFCNSNKPIANQMTEKKSLSTCPADGKCTIEAIKNKQLDVKSDQFGSTYYELSDSEKTTVILYRYTRNPIENVEDGGYKEEIIFEINNADNQLSLIDSDLQQTKMIYGRLCFCRGQTGYYKIKTGLLKFVRTKTEMQVDLDFKNNQVPQIINNINELIK